MLCTVCSYRAQLRFCVLFSRTNAKSLSPHTLLIMPSGSASIQKLACVLGKLQWNVEKTFIYGYFLICRSQHLEASIVTYILLLIYSS